MLKEYDERKRKQNESAYALLPPPSPEPHPGSRCGVGTALVVTGSATQHSPEGVVAAGANSQPGRQPQKKLGYTGESFQDFIRD